MASLGGSGSGAFGPSFVIDWKFRTIKQSLLIFLVFSVFGDTGIDWLFGNYKHLVSWRSHFSSFAVHEPWFEPDLDPMVSIIILQKWYCAELRFLEEHYRFWWSKTWNIMFSFGFPNDIIISKSTPETEFYSCAHCYSVDLRELLFVVRGTLTFKLHERNCRNYSIRTAKMSVSLEGQATSKVNRDGSSVRYHCGCGSSWSPCLWETGYWAGSAYGQGGFHTEQPVLVHWAREERLGLKAEITSMATSLPTFCFSSMKAHEHCCTLKSWWQSWMESNSVGSWIPTFNSFVPGQSTDTKKYPRIAIPMSTVTSVT